MSLHIKPCLCFHTFSVGILQFWVLRKWNRKYCARKSNSSLSGRGAWMHESIPILVLTPLHMILMSLQLPLHYLLLVKSMSNPQAGNLLLVKLKHGGGTVSSSWYCKCQRAYWLSREVWRVKFGSPDNHWMPSSCVRCCAGWGQRDQH